MNSDEPYYEELSITSRLSQKRSIELLYKIRNESLLLLTKSELFTQKGLKLGDHSCNLTLGRGPDFAGNEHVQYLPAIERYSGSFYQGFLDEGSIFQWSQKCIESSHHTIIISGLYGMLTPVEQIQLYESPLEDFHEIQDVLKKDNALTHILIDYILSHNISRVFDLTGDKAYQQLINWSLIKEYGIMTLHASAEDCGPNQLRNFGILMDAFLLEAPTDHLIRLNPGQKIGNVTFLDSPDRTGPLIFISCKSEDYSHAEKFADFLNSNGKNFFFCERDKQVSEDSDYLSRIDSALESAEHMVVIGTKKEFFGSGWVRHEWTSFLKEKLGGRKKGNILTLIGSDIEISDLPISLRQYEVFNLSHEGFIKALLLLDKREE
ncbi:peroxide stress protein YaaA [Methanospirillum purgamenti]|uniref:peroxide stress protein YaaA n=1 Tax=Methanospirillum purgamenti TaxID=2834276 RepID=UPI002A24487C|nr:peroxide stress protein YaaA [Methanospirillum hungatei]